MFNARVACVNSQQVDSKAPDDCRMIVQSDSVSKITAEHGHRRLTKKPKSIFSWNAPNSMPAVQRTKLTICDFKVVNFHQASPWTREYAQRNCTTYYTDSKDAQSGTLSCAPNEIRQSSVSVSAFKDGIDSYFRQYDVEACNDIASNNVAIPINLPGFPLNVPNMPYGVEDNNLTPVSQARVVYASSADSVPSPNLATVTLAAVAAAWLLRR